MLVRFEILKLLRSHRPLVTGLALALFLVLMLLGFYTYAQTETGGRAEFRYTFENRSYFNGLTFAVYAFYFGSVLLLPIFAALEGASQIAGETSSQTLYLLLSRPLSKSRIFLTKVSITGVYLFVAVGLFLGAALLVGLIAVGWGNLSLYPGVLQMTDRPQHLTQAAALLRFFMAWPAATLALSAPMALGFFVSCRVNSAVNAVGISVSVYLVLYLISEVHFFRELRPYLFTTYIAFWRNLFRTTIDWPLLFQDACRMMAFTTLFLALGHYRFRHRQE